MRSLASVLLLVMTACTPLLPSPQPAGPDVRHVLEPTALPTPRAAAPGAPQLAVLAVRPGPRLDGHGMLYRDASGRRGTFADNRWTAPPEEQFGDWLVAALERAGGVSAVIAPGGRGQAGLLLEVELLRLDLDAAENPGTLHMELRLQLIAGLGREVLATTRVEAREPLDAAGPAAMADAAARAMTQLLEASAGFVREAVEKHADAGGSRG